MDNFKSLEDIFADDIFDDLIKDAIPNKIERVDPDIEKFLEIVGWAKQHDGKEPQKSRDMKERSLASRLKGIRGKPEKVAKLKAYDEFNWLEVDEKVIDSPKELTLDEILEDSLFSDDEKERSLFDISRYKRTIDSKDKMSVRKKMGINFSQYETIFKQVHAEVASGERKILPFTDSTHTAKEKKVYKDAFYIDNGILLKIEDIYDQNGNHYLESNNRSHKLHTIYENGTENKNISLLGFVSNLYDTKRNGRIVTERYSDTSTIFQKTGYVYVVKYAGENQQIRSMQNLYKIGYAADVKKRLANTVNESTYLYAPVQLVAEFEIQNISAHKVEKYLHNVFSDCRLLVDMAAPNGKKIDATEWYIVEKEKIKEEIDKMITKLQTY